MAFSSAINLIPHLSKLHNHNQIHNKFPCLFTRYTKVKTTSTKLLCTMSSGIGTTKTDEPTLTASSSSSSGWADFSERVSGEWDGFGADFDKDVKPIELPERVVPDAYREWEVRVFDWQTQCPTLALPQQFSLIYKLIKLLPTVGCEADAATRHTIDERNIQSASAFAYQSNGCYVAIWPVKDHGEYKVMEVEHCLIDPRDKESRVRVIQIVRHNLENHKLELESIRVFSEQWYGPYRNGDQLGGCAIRDSAFAITKPLDTSQVIGAWESQSVNSIASLQISENNKIMEELVDDKSVHKLVVRDEVELKLLPKQLWCSLNKLEDGDNLCEAGWLLDQGHAITSNCVLSSDAKLKEIRVACETRATLQ